ncbi:hypothetical protein BXY66_0698 [Shimia isoporae]|uniref:Uncharacterized protein n=2 Tax=Shimia isoporae TaxID=647720 RepID=A0A4V2Q3V7_9RHOB|nr:hypothetical protein BXY66_0698 [Shimia isoporae]
MVLNFRVFAAFGALLMAALLALIHTNSDLIKNSSLRFVTAQIQQEVADRFPMLVDSSAEAGISKLTERFKSQETAIGNKLAEGAHLFVASAVARLCDCENNSASKTKIATALQNAMQDQIGTVAAARERLEAVIQGRYNSLLDALMRDLTIFLTTNLVAFAAIFAATFVRNGKGPMLVYPVALLSTALALGAGIYVFGTDWFYAILFQDYWGFGYSILMVCLFAILLDISANKARMTSGFASTLPSFLVPIC